MTDENMNVRALVELAYMTFPAAHCTKLNSTNPIERVVGEIKRRTEVVGIFPNEDATVRLVGATLLQAERQWAVQWRSLHDTGNDRTFERS
jgi:transposase-like protein